MYQQIGNPNQVIPPAPLVPIPAIGEPFEHVIIRGGHRLIFLI